MGYQVRLENFVFQDPQVSIHTFVLFELPEETVTDEGKTPEVSARKGNSVKFRIRQSKGFLEKIDSWDWVGIYADSAIKLKDYCASKYVSTSDWSKARIKFDPKDFKNSSSGQYRLIYHSSKLKSAIGV